MINKEGPRVVYWIGAGASAQALPIVGKMSDAFQAQAAYIRNTAFNPPVASYLVNKYSQFLHQMAQWTKEYGTIDTYARSLFLREDEQQLAQLKLHLSLYFTVEQALHSVPIETLKNYTEVRYSKLDRIDTRYMGWLALLLDKSGVWNPRINVVSWNYDLQLEHALAVYQGLDDLGKLQHSSHFSSYPAVMPSTKTDVAPPNLVHLNGIAGLGRNGDEDVRLFSGIGGLREQPSKFINALFNSYQRYNDMDMEQLSQAFGYLTFAWESTEQSNKGLEHAKAVLSAATVLVVIGYSFPSFNRKVDKELYAAFLANGKMKKRVVIQNQHIEPETFKEMVGQRTEIVKVRQETNLTQFYVPKELF